MTSNTTTPNTNKPRHKSIPLTPEQQSLVYDIYTNRLKHQYISMASIARAYHTSPSVIHRAIHTEAYRRQALQTTSTALPI